MCELGTNIRHIVSVTQNELMKNAQTKDASGSFHTSPGHFYWGTFSGRLAS
jgi:hypothetical protein